MRYFILFVFSLFVAVVNAQQAGYIDTTFGSPALTIPNTSRFDNVTTGIALQADGKIIVGGEFRTYNGDSVKGIVRLLPNGNIDPTFVVGRGIEQQNSVDNGVYAVAVDSFGKIYVVGDFDSYNGTACQNIVRINQDGSYDSTFTLSLSTSKVSHIYIQPDNKILLGGEFHYILDVWSPGRNVVRLNQTGAIDSAFIVNGSNLNGEVYGVTMQPDGKILVAVDTWRRVVRLKANGSYDNTFATAANSKITSVICLNNGNIIVGGDFTNCNGYSRKHLACIDTYGDVDTTFYYTSGFHETVYSLLAADNNSFFVSAGRTYNGIQVGVVTKILATGAVQDWLLNDCNDGGAATGMALEANGDLLACGWFSLNYYMHRGIGRIKTNGWRDDAFLVNNYLGATVDIITKQNDGKLLFHGTGPYKGYYNTGLTRVLANGTIDTSFHHDDNEVVNDVLFNAVNNKIYVLGDFYNYQGFITHSIARLNIDGSTDTSFHSGFNSASYAKRGIVQTDGKILIGGSFISYNNNATKHIIRLNADGGVDSTFITGTGFNSSVDDMVMQPDGKTIVTGQFSLYNNQLTRIMARLNTDGTLDTSFLYTSSMCPQKIALQPNGKILAFRNGVVVDTIRRFNNNGSLDTSFNEIRIGEITTFETQADGKILLGGNFNNIPSNTRIVRFTANGNIDPTFVSGTGFNMEVKDIAVMPDNKIIAAGKFTNYNSYIISAVARLHNDCSAPANLLNILGPSAVCLGAQSITYNIPEVEGADGYNWSIPIGWNGTVNNNALTLNVPQNATSANLAVSAQNACGVSDTQSFFINVNPIVAPALNVVASDTAICVGEGITLTATITNGGNNPDLVWKLNGTSIDSIVTNISLDNLSNGDLITLNVTSTAQCASQANLSYSTTITVHEPPIKPILFSTGSIIASNSSFGNQWYNANGTPVDGQTGQTFTPNETGSYYSVVTDSNGCVSLPSDTVAFIVSGLNEVDSSVDFSIYPNPTLGLVYIVSNTDAAYTVRLYNTQGALLAMKTAAGTSGSINLDSFANGIYYLIVEDADNIVMRKRILKL